VGHGDTKTFAQLLVLGPIRLKVRLGICNQVIRRTNSRHTFWQSGEKILDIIHIYRAE